MKHRHNFTLSPEAIAILRAMAEKNGVSMSAMLEIIIRKYKTMKAQQTNQTVIEAIVKDNLVFVLELIAKGMTREDAIEAQVDGMMNDPYDEGNYDAPYDKNQLIKAFSDKFDELF
jgi:hypothetical protein